MRHAMRASLASICSVFLASALGFTQNNSENHPLAVSFNEVRDHLKGDPPLIRVSLPQRESALLGMEGIPVRVTVDVNGNVISAIADKSASAAALALIRHGANLNTQNKDGLTAIINSVSPDVARVLVENGADLNLRDKEGKTALEEAKRFNRPEKAAVLEAAQAHRQ